MTEYSMPRLSPNDRQQLQAALERADDALVETSLGGVQVCGALGGPRLMLCHGAGAGHESAFLERLRHALAAEGVQVVAVEFAYRRQARLTERRRPPPAVARLVTELGEWQRTLSAMAPQTPLWLGGKSMGARVASMLASEEGAAGVVLCGYPFHPPSNPERLRLEHWPTIACPLMLIQGTRDPFGRRDQVESYTLPAHLECHFLEGGDHDWRPLKRSAMTRAAMIDHAAALIGRRLRASG